jgi:hypothetical protein
MNDAALRRYRRALVKAQRSTRHAANVAGNAWRTVRDLKEAADALAPTMSTEGLRRLLTEAVATALTNASQTHADGWDAATKVDELAALSGVKDRR